MEEHLNRHFIILITRAFVQQGLYIHSRHSEEQCTSTDKSVRTFSSPGPRCYNPGSFSSTAALAKILVRDRGWGGFGQSKVGCNPGLLDSSRKWVLQLGPGAIKGLARSHLPDFHICGAPPGATRMFPPLLWTSSCLFDRRG